MKNLRSEIIKFPRTSYFFEDFDAPLIRLRRSILFPIMAQVYAPFFRFYLDL